MSLTRVTASRVRGHAGAQASHEFAVRLTDAAGNPLEKKSILFSVNRPGAVLFGSATYDTAETDSHGIATVSGTIQEVGRFEVTAKAAPGDRRHTVNITVIGEEARAGGGSVDDDILYVDAGGSGSRWWPAAIAAMVIAALIVGGLVFSKAIGGSASSGAPGTIAIADDAARQAAATARLEAERATAAAEAATRQAAAAATKDDVDGALLANSASDQAYAATRADANVHDQVFDQEAFARMIRLGRKREAQRLVCRTNPNSPACLAPVRRFASAP